MTTSVRYAVPGTAYRSERVEHRLAQALMYPVAVLCAPSGYGKTTVMSLFLSDYTGSHVFVSAGGRANSLIRFIRPLADALGEMQPAVALSAASAIERALYAPNAAADLAAWLSGHLAERPVLIVIDDLPAPQDDALGEFISHMITLSPSTRWCLLTRSTGALPVPTWMANEWMDFPLDESTLRYTQDDMRALRRHTPVTHSSAGIGEFPLAVFYPQLSMRSDLQYEEIARFGFEESSEDEREFYLATCMLPYLTEELLEHLEGDWARQIALRASHRFPFLFVYGNQGLQFHDLFASFLLQRVRESGEFDATLQRSIDALIAAGAYSAAVLLPLELGEREVVLQAIEQAGLALTESDADVVLEALDFIGDEATRRSAVAMCLRAVTESRSDRADTAESWFAHAAAAAVGDQRREITYLYATELIRQERADALEMFEGLLKDEPADSARFLLLLSGVAESLMLAGRATEAEPLTKRALHLVENLADNAIRARVYIRAAYVAFYTRNLGHAERLSRLAAQAAEQCGHFTVAAAAYFTLANIEYDREHVDGAVKHFRSMADCGIKSGNVQFHLVALVNLFEIEAERDNVQGLIELDRALHSFDVSYAASPVMQSLLPAQALRAAGNGDFAHAHTMLAASAETQPTNDRRGLRYAEVALYAAAAHRNGSANAALDLALETLASCDRTDAMVLRGYALATLAAILLQRDDAARAAVTACEDSVRPRSRLRILLEVVASLAQRAFGEDNYATVESLLERLRQQNFGGFARMLESVPFALAMQRRQADRTGDDYLGRRYGALRR